MIIGVERGAANSKVEEGELAALASENGCMVNTSSRGKDVGILFWCSI